MTVDPPRVAASDGGASSHPRAHARRSLGLVLFAVAFGTNVSTPLLLRYETELGLTTWTVTALFAVYPLGLAPALAYAGPASDVLGRRAVVAPGLVLSAVASIVMIIGADSVVLLGVGRFLLGAVSGLVFVTASAWMQELGREDPMWAARLTGLVMYAGFGLGPLVSGALGQWGPWPLVLPYAVHLVIVAAGMVALRSIPETVERDRSRRIRPNLGIPARSRSDVLRVVLPTAIGVFGFPSLVFGLFPVLLRPAMGGVAVFATGVVGLLAMASIVPAQAWVGRVGAANAAPVGLGAGTLGCVVGFVAFATDAWPLLFVGALMMGVASGLCMTSGLRLVDAATNPSDRGALTGTFYAVAYAGMTMPVVVSTAARGLGYETVLAILASAGLAVTVWLVRAVSTMQATPANRST